MSLNKSFTHLILSCFLSLSLCLNAVENSIIPTIEKYEVIENLPVHKYSTNQFEEISQALKHVDEKIRLVSYNILFNLYDQNHEEVNRWPQRFPRIVALIEEMQPDIIGVQELYSDQLEDLWPYLKEVYAFYSKPSEYGELNGIFYRKDRFDVEDRKVFYMVKEGQKPNSETLTLLQLKDLKTGKHFAVCNTHLSFSKVDKRDFQVRFIAKHLASYAKKMPTIFTGDLNTFPNRLDAENLPFYDGDYVNRLLTKASVRDAKTVSLLGHVGPLSTYSNEGSSSTPFKGRGTPGVFLDHIYVSKEINVLIHGVQAGTVDGHFPSDHFPILIDFFIK